MTALRLMAILAHPDDESLGNGGTLARYAAEGVEVTLVTATRGQRGWFGEPSDNPGLTALGATREAELRAAARALGIHELVLLDYVDGDLDQADPELIECELVAHIRRVQPDVVLTWGPDGGYGHPDHIAIGQFATAAVMRAADPRSGHRCASRGPHAVSKLYYMAITPERAAAYAEAFGEIAIEVDGTERLPVVLPDWLVRTRIDAGDHWRTAWQAVTCHRSQLPNFDQLAAQSDAAKRRLWGYWDYYRAYSTVNGGRSIEIDLFEGLRTSSRGMVRAA
jgi:LmbE family N-acetylglucosaminyl deacetylase